MNSRRFIPESARWLVSVGKVQLAEKIIRKAAKVNGVPQPDVIFTENEIKELQVCVFVFNNLFTLHTRLGIGNQNGGVLQMPDD